VNAICPGLIDTPFQDRVWGSEKAKNDFGAASIAGRMGTSEEMAKVVAFLASDDSTFVSGHGLLAEADTWLRDQTIVTPSEAKFKEAFAPTCDCRRERRRYSGKYSQGYR
jgi:hypothetical protein